MPRPHNILITAAALICVLLAPCTARALDGVPRIIDGDTIAIGAQHIRLFGIDAPERRQACTRDGRTWQCGIEAGMALAGIIGGHWIHCVARDRDRYRRIVAICYLAHKDINGEMVREGWALDYRYYSKGRYASKEAEARKARRGIWSGRFVKPWEWRRKRR